jgi:2-methylisocitrate lyase-like PEP mutase family enzyme
VLLTARTEGFIVGRPELAETVARLRAFAEVGADCLYAPGIRTADDIAAVVAAVAPRPVNLLVHAAFITVAKAARLGVRRISIGGALARAAWAGTFEAAREILEQGTFQALSAAVPSSELNGRFPARTSAPEAET